MKTLIPLIDNFLDISKIEKGHFKLDNDAFNFHSIIGQINNIFNYVAIEKDLKFSCIISKDVPQVLIGDIARLKQVLSNLIDNAFKFTIKGEICLEIQVDSNAEDSNSIRLLFKISDTGIGIPQDKLQTVFERFAQIDSSLTKKYKGLGIGLAISKELVEKMNGKIWVESDIKKGTSFYFTIEFKLDKNIFKEDLKVVNQLADSEIQTSNQIKLLIADDDEYVIDIVRGFLKLTNLEIENATNGNEAVEKIKTNKYDIILMDLQMPELNGLEVIEIIRGSDNNDTLSTTPIIVLSGHALNEYKQKSIEAGCNDFLKKPFSKNELIDVINKYLKVYN